MKFNFTGVFMGNECRISNKTGEVYNYVGFANGLETLQLNCPTNIDCNGLELYKPYNVEVDYVTAFKNFKLVGVSPLKG